MEVQYLKNVALIVVYFLDIVIMINLMIIILLLKNRINGIRLKIQENFQESKKIISNDPATVILWEDGTKTMAKCQDGDVFDFEKGVLICSLKKLIGNRATNELLNQTEKEKTNISAKKQKQKDCTTCQYEEIIYTSYPCNSCLRRYWRDGKRLNWEPRK